MAYPIKHNRRANKCVLLDASDETVVLIWWWQCGHVITWLSGPKGVGTIVGITTTKTKKVWVLIKDVKKEAEGV